MNPLKALVHWAGQLYIRRVCSSESQNQVFRVHNERPIEYRFSLDVLAQHPP
jgi:hypothetical protein